MHSLPHYPRPLPKWYIYYNLWTYIGLPSWYSGKESACQCRRCKRRRISPWVGKIPWRRKWQPTPVFLPGEFHGQKSLAGYSPWGRKESDTTERRSTQQRNPHWHVFVIQSAQFTFGFTLGATHSVGLDKCVRTCVHHCHAEYCHCPRHPLCSSTLPSFPLISCNQDFAFFRMFCSWNCMVWSLLMFVEGLDHYWGLLTPVPDSSLDKALVVIQPIISSQWTVALWVRENIHFQYHSGVKTI